jgi:hypothetical protein
MGNNSNRKKVLNILLFLSFLLCGLLVGFFVNRYYYNRDKGTQNQSKNTAIVSNQSNSSNSVMKSNSTNENSEWVCVFNDTNNCDTYYNPNRITNTQDGKKVWVTLTGESAKDAAVKLGAENNIPAERYNNWSKTLILYEFDYQCQNIHWISNLSYDINRHIIYSARNKSGGWDSIVPNSPLYNFCNMVYGRSTQENSTQENSTQENSTQ